MAIESSISASLFDGSPAAAAAASSDEKNENAMEFIEEMSKNVESVQKRVLAEILSQNANTEYLQRFNLHGATDRDTFKSNVPVITYQDIKPDIDRIANGDKSPIFSSLPISEFHISSGTSGGEKKLFPVTHEDLIRIHKFRSLLKPIIKSYIPDIDKGKGLNFIFTMNDIKTPGGVVARPAITSFYKNSQFYNRSFDPYRGITSPIETIFCADSSQSMYAQMLCGIIMREEVLSLGAAFGSGLLHAIRFLQLNWKKLCQDIETGTLNLKLVTDPSVRECMMMRFLCKPNPELAKFMEKECESENWEKIIPRIWPNTKYLGTIVTGTMAQYIPTLDYYSGGLPLVSSIYASSECYFGVNLNPLCQPSEISYTILPNMCYFEFIPYDDNNIDDSSSEISPPCHCQLVDLANLEIGKEYEIVVTTYAGLCRYRIGDILQVTGIHNTAPQVKFVQRTNVLLSIDVDKTSEVELQRGIKNASALLRPYNVDVLEYTSYADIKSRLPGHYVIYWELRVNDDDVQGTGTTKTNELIIQEAVLNECCLAIEGSLNWLYKALRGKGNIIGPLEIRVVKNGTFEELMNDAISKGTSINQYKVPRCVSIPTVVEFLDSRVVSMHFSPDPDPPPSSIHDVVPPTFAASTTSAALHAVTC